jgi:hypothetical protein
MSKRIDGRRFWLSLLIVMSMLAVVACRGESTPESQAEGKALERGATEAQADSQALSGSVSETMDSGGYTYIYLDTGAEKKWVAMPQIQVEVGQKVELVPGMEMANFTSRTLNRTFDTIIFSPGPFGQAEAPENKGMKAAHGGLSLSEMMSSKDMGRSAGAPVPPVKVEKASGPDAYTVVEIYEKGVDLNETPVVVRGQVMKVISGVLGKNWIHLQDGTGEAGKGNHDLVVTSQDQPEIGDVVTAKGTLYRDKDFGAGYRYDVIVEDAAVQLN